MQKQLYRDGTTYSVIVAYLRMSTDKSYRDVALARFGHTPTSHEVRRAIEDVRRYGVRRTEACDQKGTG